MEFLTIREFIKSPKAAVSINRLERAAAIAYEDYTSDEELTVFYNAIMLTLALYFVMI